MREQLQQILKTHPRHYTIIIKKDQAMMKWIEENTKSNSDSFSARIYSAAYDVSDICVNGNQKKYSGLQLGFTGCGHAAVCKCTRDTIAIRSVQSHASKTKEEKAATNEVRKQSMIQKYGVAFNNHRSDVIEKLQAPKISGIALEKLSDKSWLHEEYVTKQRSGKDIAIELDVDTTTVKSYLQKCGFDIRKRSNYSIYEQEIADYLTTIGISSIQGDIGSLGDRRELDILVNTHNVAFELNGLYWHSFHPSVKNTKITPDRHLKKTLDAAHNGIHLLHFTDRDWNVKKDVVKSIMALTLDKPSRSIDASECKIIETTQATVDVVEFIAINSLNDGHDESVTYKLIVHDEEVVAVFGFVLAINSEVKIKSITPALNTKVEGIVDMVVNYIHENIPHTIMISVLCDLSISNGKEYTNVGFQKDIIVPPNYIWTDGDIVVSREQCYVDVLPDWLKTYDGGKTVDQNMFDAKYRKYFDCGYQKYVHIKE